MAVKVGELTAFINGNNKGLDSTLSDSKSKMKSTGAQLGKIAVKGAAIVGSALAGIGIASLKSFGTFDTSMRKVSTIMDENVVSYENMKKGSIDLSNQIGIDVLDINESLYQMISATGDTENALALVEIAGKASIGGFTDVTTAVDGLTSVMNAFGESGPESMQRISDEMLVAQNVGKTTFGEMAGSIGKVAPIANSLNVTTQELFGSIATLTKNGIKTAESVTALKGAYSNIVKPTKQATDEAEKLGLQFSATRLAQVGWAAFIDEVAAATDGNTESMANLFGSVEALNAMLILTGEEGGKDFDNAMTEMADSAGSTQAAFETMDEGIADSMEDLQNHLKNTSIQIGEELAPMAENLLIKIDDLVLGFSQLSDEQKESAVQTGLWIGGISIGIITLGAIAGAVTKIATFAHLAAGGLSAIGAAAGGISAGAVVAAAAAVAAMAYALPKMYDDIQNWMQPEAIAEFESYMDNPYQWKQGQRQQQDYDRYQRHMEKMYPEAPTSEELGFVKWLEASGIGELIVKGSQADPGNVFHIDIHGNEIKEEIDIDNIGDKLMDRLNKAGFFKE